MLKLMIVDDDKNIRDRVSSILSGVEGVEIVSQAEDGEEAMALFCEDSPNIVILDINIPGISGMEAAERMLTEDKDVRIIIVTGYHEFQYAQQALKLGVFDFLTKPIDAGELLKVVGKAADYFASLREQKMSRERLNELLEESLPVLRERFLKTLLEKAAHRDDGSLMHTARRLGITLQGLPMVVVIIEPHFSEEDLNDIGIVIVGLENVFREILGESGFSYYLYFDGLYRAVVVLELTEANDMKKLEHVLAGISDKVKFYLNISICSAIGSFVEHLSELSDSYSSAAEALQYQRVFAQNNVVNHINILHMGFANVVSFEAEIDEIVRAIRFDSADGLTEKLNAFFRKALAAASGNRKFLRKHLFRLISSLNLLSAELLYELDLENFYQRVLLTDDILGLSAFIREICLEMQSRIQKNRSARGFWLVDCAKKYIDENYLRSDITLHEVSESIGLSEKYFCRLFHKQTGAGFTDYINEKRIKRAKELLLTTQLKVYEVAEQAGFPNVKYFIVLFKKYTGATPQGFRTASV